MIGQKGLPATVGGIEHHVEQIGKRLAERGHDVTVYCRRSYGDGRDSTYRGLRLQYAPTVGTKHLDALLHSASSTALAMGGNYDVVHYHAMGPGIMAPFPRYLSAAKVVLTVHGLDHQRQKWGRLAQTLMSSAYWMSGHVPDRTVVVSRDLRQHYAREFGRACTYIPNGVESPEPQDEEHVEALGLQPGRYALFVGRLVPEKCPDMLVRAFRSVPGDVQLAVVGGASFTSKYADTVRRAAAADLRVVVPGLVHGDQLSALYQHAAVFVQPSLLEGLPLTLLEAVANGSPVVASDIAPHVEVLGDRSVPGQRLFRAGDERALTDVLAKALANAAEERVAASTLRDRVLAAYNWETAVDQLEDCYLALVRPPKRS